MNSWSFVTSLVVLVNVIVSSKAHCSDLFTLKGITLENLSDNVTLVSADDSLNMMSCTLRSECCRHNKKWSCNFMDNCFEETCESRDEFCGEEREERVSLFNFRCLLAMVLQEYHPNYSNMETPKGCGDGKSLCSLYQEVSPGPDPDRTKPPAAGHQVLVPVPVSVPVWVLVSVLVLSLSTNMILAVCLCRSKTRTTLLMNPVSVLFSRGEGVQFDTSSVKENGDDGHLLQLESVLTQSADDSRTHCLVADGRQH